MIPMPRTRNSNKKGDLPGFIFFFYSFPLFFYFLKKGNLILSNFQFWFFTENIPFKAGFPVPQKSSFKKIASLTFSFCKCLWLSESEYLKNEKPQKVLEFDWAIPEEPTVALRPKNLQHKYHWNARLIKGTSAWPQIRLTVKLNKQRERVSEENNKQTKHCSKWKRKWFQRII